jgi:hypothetical protein
MFCSEIRKIVLRHPGHGTNDISTADNGFHGFVPHNWHTLEVMLCKQIRDSADGCNRVLLLRFHNASRHYAISIECHGLFPVCSSQSDNLNLFDAERFDSDQCIMSALVLRGLQSPKLNSALAPMRANAAPLGKASRLIVTLHRLIFAQSVILNELSLCTILCARAT